MAENRIISVSGGYEMKIARQLLLEYASSLGFNLCFQNFSEELENLPGVYGPPDGIILLSRSADDYSGSVCLRKIGSGICEMKRLYVRPQFRGKGLGRILAESVIREAKAIGYEIMRLDTIPSMKEAVSLYRSIGFKETEPYRENPIDGAIFLELDLKPGGGLQR